MKVSIDPDRCLRYEKCYSAEACPTKAIYKVELDGPAVVELEYCYGCGDCIEKCPAKAIKVDKPGEDQDTHKTSHPLNNSF